MTRSLFTTDTFYKSREWESFRALLMQERTDADGNIICARCGKPITRKYDCIAHHVVELTDDNVNDYSVSFNPDNVELIHFRCHNVAHERFEGFEQTVYLVYGPPCAGKTTWVRSVANADDLIIDVDAIWEAVCLSDRLHKPKRLRANVFGIRDALIDQVRTRTGMWRAAYVIGGYPLQTDRERLCALVRARPIYIDATEAECLQRAPDEAWRGYVRDWFDSYTA